MLFIYEVEVTHVNHFDLLMRIALATENLWDITLSSTVVCNVLQSYSPTRFFWNGVVYSYSQ